MGSKTPFLDLEFQGFPCSPIFEVTRSAGYDPDFGFVHIARQDLGDKSGNITIEDPPGPGGLMQALQSGAPIPSPGAGKLYACGDLTIKDQDEDGKGQEYRIARLLLSENSLSAVEATDGAADGLIRIELTDVRKLWDDFGVLWAWINVPARTLAQAGGDVTQAQGPPLIPGTTDGGKGVPWTLRRVLETYIMPNLPGRPKLKRLSESLEKVTVGPHQWDGVRTKVAMQELLAEFDALPTLELDNSVSVWKRGDGPLQDVTGKAIEKGKKDGAEDDRVASRTIRMSHRVTVPDVVVVLGRPVVETRSMDLIAVGEDSHGNLVPLSAALASIGDVPNLAEILALPHEIRAAAGVTDQGLRKIERWAYKWYAPRVVVFGQPNDLLPFEDLAETDQTNTGIRLKPIVQAESITSVRVNVMRSGEEAASTAKDSTQKNKVEPTNTSSIPKGSGVDSPDTRTFTGPAVVVATDGGPVTVHPDVDSYYVLKNLPMSTQQSGAYEIDRKRGVVMFSTPRVTLAKDEVPPLIAQFKAAGVKLTVGVERKPSYTEQLSMDFRYSSVWKFQGKRDRESLDLQQATASATPSIVKIDPKADPVSSPLSGAFVVDTDLQLLKAIDGRTNEKGLDQIAKQLAAGKILASRFVPGAVIELVGFVPVIPTGRILSVVFRSSDGVPQTIAHDGQPAPLRAGPKQLNIDAIRKNLVPALDAISARNLPFMPDKR